MPLQGQAIIYAGDNLSGFARRLLWVREHAMAQLRKYNSIGNYFDMLEIERGIGKRVQFVHGHAMR